MQRLVLALWALLLGQGSSLVQSGPGAAPQDLSDGTRRTGVNMTCFQCFKVTKRELCRPRVCSATDQVCVSHTLLLFFKFKMKTLLSKRCAPRCPNTNSVYEWLSEPWLVRRIVRQCCNESFCNAAPPSTPGHPWPPPAGLLLPLGLSLLGALL